jgi:hypothetical protein
MTTAADGIPFFERTMQTCLHRFYFNGSTPRSRMVKSA